MRTVLIGLCGVAVLCAPPPVGAATLQFNLGTQFVSVDPDNNTPTSASTAPYGTMTFTDMGTVSMFFGTSPIVQLTVAASLENPNEWFRFLAFNSPYASGLLTPTQTGSTGSFTAPAGPGFGTVNLQPPTGFDYLLNFAEATPSGTVNAAINFDGTDSITFSLTCQNTPAAMGVCGVGGSNPLSAVAFNTTNTDASGNPGYTGWYALAWLGYSGVPKTLYADGYHGARYGDNTNDNLVSAVVPEPGSLLLIGTGLAVLLRRRSRRSAR